MSFLFFSFVSLSDTFDVPGTFSNIKIYNISVVFGDGKEVKGEACFEMANIPIVANSL